MSYITDVMVAQLALCNEIKLSYMMIIFLFIQMDFVMVRIFNTLVESATIGIITQQRNAPLLVLISPNQTSDATKK